MIFCIELFSTADNFNELNVNVDIFEDEKWVLNEKDLILYGIICMCVGCEKEFKERERER